MAVAAAAVLAPGVAAAQDGADDIDIVSSPNGEQGPCLPVRAALRHEVISDPSTFTLRITAVAPPCTPVQAVAAVYGMPGNGAAWPQRLLQTEGFTIDSAGTVDVVFTKTCVPVQFDVVTGATPEVISPLGAHHGALLFPDDINTSHQHFGSQCPAPTTTTTAAPPTSESTTSTAPPEVEGATTSSVPPAAAPSDEPLPPADEPLVLAAAQEPPGGEELAFAGADVWSAVLAGAALVFAGGSLLSARRARRQSA